MSLRVLPATVAVIFAVGAAVLLFVPFVAREYRKRGELGTGTAVLRFAGLLYGLGVLAYVLLPLPRSAATVCADYAYIHPQWTPLATFATVRWDAGLAALANNEGAQQFALNIVLFAPLGMFARYLLAHGVGASTLLGLVLSCAIELTQLTGNWYSYPCSYRVCDVDDVIANSIGALAGNVFGPVLSRPTGHSSGQRSDRSPCLPRPVTVSRRLLGMFCDVVLLWLLGVVAGQLLPMRSVLATSAALWCFPALLLLAATVAGRGSTLGQYAVLLRSVGPGRIRLRAVVLRWFSGLGGLAIIEVLCGASGQDVAFGAGVLWCVLHAFGVTRSSGHRGISGWVARLDVVDARAQCAERHEACDTARRRTTCGISISSLSVPARETRSSTIGSRTGTSHSSRRVSSAAPA